MEAKGGEIIVDGKGFISAKEAARKSGYTPDYIGQLARAGEFESRLVGKTRFVDTEGLHNYITRVAARANGEKGEKARDTLVRARSSQNTSKTFTYEEDLGPLYPEPKRVQEKQGEPKTTKKDVDEQKTSRRSVSKTPTTTTALVPRGARALVVIAVVLLVSFGGAAIAREGTVVGIQDVLSQLGQRTHIPQTFSRVSNYVEESARFDFGKTQVAGVFFGVESFFSFVGELALGVYCGIFNCEDEQTDFVVDEEALERARQRLVQEEEQRQPTVSVEPEEPKEGGENTPLVVTGTPQTIIERVVERPVAFAQDFTTVTADDIDEAVFELRTELEPKIKAAARSPKSSGSSGSNFFRVTGGNFTGDISGLGASFNTLTASTLTASGVFSGTTGSFSTELGIGTTSPSDTLALDGALYLAQITAPGNTTNRLYNDAGDLYWAGSVVGGSTVGTWATDGTNVWRAGGNVGIGTTSPQVSLSIDGTDAALLPVGTTAQRPGTPFSGFIRFNTSTVQFEGYNGSVWSGLGGVTDVDQDTFILAESSPGADEDALTFTTFGTQKAVLDANGSFGIGTTSPASLLDVWGDVRVGTSSTPTLFVDVSTGRVGLGTVSPSSLLDVEGEGSLTSLTLDDKWSFQTETEAGTERLTLKATGVDSAAELFLHPTGSATSSRVTISDDQNTNNYEAITLESNGTSNYIKSIAEGTGTVLPLLFEIGGSDVLTLATNGNIGIGTTSPFAKLSVAGGGYFDGALTFSSLSATSTTATSTFANHISIGSAKEFRVNGIGVLTRTGTGATVLGNLSGGVRGASALDLQTEHLVSDIASGASSVAVGLKNEASGSFANVFGFGNTANDFNTISVGLLNTSAAEEAATFGYSNTTNNLSGSAFGNNNTVSGDFGSAFGAFNTASNEDAAAFGYSNTASGFDSSAFGNNNTVSGFRASAFGYNNTVSINGASVFGSGITNTVATSTMIGPSDSAKLTILSSGSLGIGTTSPFAKLSVAGDGYFDGALTFSSFSATSTTATSTIAGGLNIGSGNLVYDFSSQNVGIGTTTLSDKLTLAGSFGQKPSAPTEVGSVSIGTPVEAFNTFDVQGNYVVISASQTNQGIRVIDVTEPNNPEAVGSLGLTGTAEGIRVRGSYAYVTVGNVLHVVDISNPASPVSIGNVPVFGGFIEVSGRYAYVVDVNANDAFLYIVDISEPSEPRVVSNSYNQLGTDSSGNIVVKGRYLYSGNQGSQTITITDISNPEAPSLVSTLSTGRVGGLAVSGRYLYFTDRTGGQLEIADVSDPKNPSLVSSVGGVASGNAPIIVSGDYAYVHSNGQIVVVDVGDISNPTILHTVSLSGDGFMDISGRYLYVLENVGNTLKVFDIQGTEFSSAIAHSLQSSVLRVRDNADVGQNLSVEGGLNVGLGGILSAGPLSVGIASSTQANALSAFFQGNVGVGTTSPASLLDVWGDFRVGTSSIPALFADVSAGRVGIGVVDPTAPTHILSDASGFALTIEENLGSEDWQIGVDANGSLTFTDSGSQKLIFEDDTGGGLGINITDPTGILHVRGSPNQGGSVYVDRNDGSVSQNDVLGKILFDSSDSFSTSDASVVLGAFAAESFSVNDKGGYFTISTKPENTGQADPAFERLRVSANGNVGIGTTSPFATLSASGTVAFANLSTSAGTPDALCLSADNEVTVNTGSADCTVSSERFKENIQSLSGGLATLRAFNPVSFRFKEGDDSEHLGLIAEEVFETEPRLVFFGDDGRPRGVRYNEAVALTISAIQELDNEIKQLQPSSTTFVTSDESFSERVVRVFRDFGIRISKNVAQFVSIITKRLTVGSPEVPTGITLYDEETSEPYCLSVKNGRTVTREGVCETSHETEDTSMAGGGGTGTDTDTTEGSADTVGGIATTTDSGGEQATTIDSGSEQSTTTEAVPDNSTSTTTREDPEETEGVDNTETIVDEATSSTENSEPIVDDSETQAEPEPEFEAESEPTPEIKEAPPTE